MKWLWILFLLTSCGSKNKVQVSGGVTTPTEFNVNHKISVDDSQFEESCTEQYKNIPDSTERNAKIDQCIVNKEEALSQLLKVLTSNPPEDE